MTLEQAYKKVDLMSEILDTDILSYEEGVAVARLRSLLIRKIELEENRLAKLKRYNIPEKSFLEEI